MNSARRVASKTTLPGKPPSAALAITTLVVITAVVVAVSVYWFRYMKSSDEQEPEHSPSLHSSSSSSLSSSSSSQALSHSVSRYESSTDSLASLLSFTDPVRVGQHEREIAAVEDTEAALDIVEMNVRIKNSESHHYLVDDSFSLHNFVNEAGWDRESAKVQRIMQVLARAHITREAPGLTPFAGHFTFSSLVRYGEFRVVLFSENIQSPMHGIIQVKASRSSGEIVSLQGVATFGLAFLDSDSAEGLMCRHYWVLAQDDRGDRYVAQLQTEGVQPTRMWKSVYESKVMASKFYPAEVALEKLMLVWNATLGDAEYVEETVRAMLSRNQNERPENSERLRNLFSYLCVSTSHWTSLNCTTKVEEALSVHEDQLLISSDYRSETISDETERWILKALGIYQQDATADREEPRASSVGKDVATR